MKAIQEEKLYERLRKAVQRRNPDHRLKRSREGSAIWHSFGCYWIYDCRRNCPVDRQIDLESLANQLRGITSK